MKVNELSQRVLLVLFVLGAVACPAYSGGELKEGEKAVELEPLKTPVRQPFSGKLVLLLNRAIELHKTEVDVPLEKYMVRIEEDDKFYYIFFIDPEKDPLMFGSRKEVPGYTVVASKETFEILEHHGVR